MASLSIWMNHPMDGVLLSLNVASTTSSSRPRLTTLHNAAWPLPVSLSKADRHDTAQPAAASHGQAPVLDKTRRTILIVDDDPMLLDTLADLIDLRMPNAQVVTCSSGAEALKMVTTIHFDAVISDLKMPHMDGFTLMTKIQLIQPFTPILIITGHGDQALRVKADELGAFAFLAKPLDRDAFMMSLQQAMAHRGSPGEGIA
ncbi:MAG: response regulator [Nitrospirota bacterium]|nr:response regulator [Nitrospirota bacterium]